MAADTSALKIQGPDVIGNLVPVNLKASDFTFGGGLQPNVFILIEGTLVTLETTIWTPAAGKKFRWMGGQMSFTGTVGNLTVRDGVAGTHIGFFRAVLNQAPFWFSFGDGILSAVANNVLTMQSTAATGVDGMVWGREE